MLPDRVRATLDKIISDAETGERATQRALAMPRLRPYLAPEHAIWKLGAGTVVLCGCVLRGLHWALRAAFAAAVKDASKKDEKTGAVDGKEAADKEKKGAKKPSAKKGPTNADLAEQIGIGLLTTVVCGVVVVIAVAAAGPRVTPYLPAAIPVWIVAAIAVAPEKPQKKEAVEQGQAVPALSPQDATERDRIALLVILEAATRGHNGVHFGELHQRLAGHPLFGDVQRAYVGPLLDGLEVPYQRSLSVDGVGGRSGVRRADVEALLLALPQNGDAAPHEPSESGSDLQESRPLSDDSQAPLGPVSGAV